MQESKIDNSDARLARARAGDAEAIRSLLVELIPRVRNLVRYLARGDANTDDYTQDALIIVLRDLRTYREAGSFRAWVDRVVARATIRRLRSERARAVVELQPGDAFIEPAGTSDELMLRRSLVRLLDRLPYHQRHVLVLHHVLEMTVTEISQELDASPETVRSRLRLAKKKLRELGLEVEGKDDAAE